ncbi:hypothetical protein ACFE04_020371 [Oxalis oulophora]
MAKILGCVVCILVVIMAAVAGVLSFKADDAENKKMQFKQSIFECRFKSHGAYKRGLAAVIILSLSHVIVNLLAGFLLARFKINPGKGSSIFRHLSVASLIFSWIAYAIGFTILIIATMGNRKHGMACGVSQHRFFYVGGVMCFVHGFFALVACAAAIAMIHKKIGANVPTRPNTKVPTRPTI